MSGVAIPAPGGAVTPGRFAIMALGGGLGIYAYTQFVAPSIPDTWENWSIGPIQGTTVWFAAFALLGGAAASMAFSKFAK